MVGVGVGLESFQVIVQFVAVETSVVSGQREHLVSRILYGPGLVDGNMA